jgi:PAS domain S-box-containing protein
VEERTVELTVANLSLQEEIIERKEAERSLKANESKFRTLVENLPQNIVLKDSASVYQYCNDRYAQGLGIKAEEAPGKSDYDFYPRERAERYLAEDRRVRESGRAEEIEERYGQNGHEVVIRKFKLPIKNEKGSVTGILDILWDVTERVRLESIAEAADMMNNLGYIFSGIRHEIGNPIHSLKIILGVLGNKIGSSPPEDLAAYVARAASEISRVEYLLKALKNFNMYETPEPQVMGMKPFLNNLLSLASEDFVKQGIRVECSLQPEGQWGCFDPRALQQVILNILSNAADALRGRAEPRIGIEARKMDGRIRLRVEDNGWGISPEQQRELFKPFRTTKPGGTGLGLVIAKKMLTAMNGGIEIQSRKDQGTIVDISIPEGKHEPS